MIYNALVRFQAHQILTANEEGKERNDETFGKLYQPIKQNLSNTIISFEWIEKHYSCYQALLEQIAEYLICDTKCWKETTMGILFLDNEANKNLNIKIHNFRSSTIEDVNNYLRRCWNKCLENPNTLIPAFKIKMLNGEKSKIERLTTLKYFCHKFLEEDQTDDSINNSDTIRSNNVKICISSENNHSLIWNDTMQEIDVSVIPSKENCDKTISTNNSPLEDTKSFNNTTEIPVTTSEFKTQSSEMLLTSTPVSKNKETNQNQGSDHIISIKPIFQPVPDSPLSKTSKYLSFILEEKELIRTFDRRRKLLKQVQNFENLSNYKGCVATIEVKVLCEEERLKKELKIFEPTFVEETDGDSLLPDPVKCDADREKYNDLVKN